MAIYEFPYTNFHELNLDWVIAEVKKLYLETQDLKKSVERIEPLISAEVKKYLDELLESGQLETIITESISNLQNQIDETNNKIKKINLQSMLDFKPYNLVATKKGDFLQYAAKAGNYIAGVNYDVNKDVNEFVTISSDDYNTIINRVNVKGALNHFNGCTECDGSHIYVCGTSNDDGRNILKVAVPSMEYEKITVDILPDNYGINDISKGNSCYYVFGSAGSKYHVTKLSEDLSTIIESEEYTPNELFGGVTGRWTDAQSGFTIGNKYYLICNNRDFAGNMCAYYMIVFDENCVYIGQTPTHKLFKYAELEGVLKVNDGLLVGYVLQQERSIAILLSVGGTSNGDSNIRIDANNTLNQFGNSKYIASAYYQTCLEGMEKVNATIESDIDEDITGFQRMGCPLWIAGNNKNISITCTGTDNERFKTEYFSRCNLKKLPTHDNSTINIYNCTLDASAQFLYAGSSTIYLRSSNCVKKATFHQIGTFNCIIVATNNTITGTGVAIISTQSGGSLHNTNTDMFKDY